jgi:hypothetical protein
MLESSKVTDEFGTPLGLLPSFRWRSNHLQKNGGKNNNTQKTPTGKREKKIC